MTEFDESSEIKNLSLQTIRELVEVTELRLNESNNVEPLMAFGEDSGKKIRKVRLGYEEIHFSLQRIERPENSPAYDSETGTFLQMDAPEGTVNPDVSSIISHLVNDREGIDGIQIPGNIDGVHEETVDFLFKYSQQSLRTLVDQIKQATVI